MSGMTEIIPSPPEQETEPSTDHAYAQGARAGMSWARRLKRVFDIDIDRCPNCGGALKIIAAIEDPPVIVRILAHLGLPTRTPPRAPARRVDLSQTAREPKPIADASAGQSEFERAPRREQIKRCRPMHRPNPPKQKRDFH